MLFNKCLLLYIHLKLVEFFCSIATFGQILQQTTFFETQISSIQPACVRWSLYCNTQFKLIYCFSYIGVKRTLIAQYHLCDFYEERTVWLLYFDIKSISAVCNKLYILLQSILLTNNLVEILDYFIRSFSII